jgi:uncharacterized low-complexity protein
LVIATKTVSWTGSRQQTIRTHLEKTMSKTIVKPVAAAVGFALAGTLSIANLADAADNPFGATQLSHGYVQVAEADKPATEGKCGGAKMSAEQKKAAEGKCGEGKCGAAGKAATEKKAVEGKCGAQQKPGEGKCGGAK